MNNKEEIEFIILNNGVKYTKNQIRKMFRTQIDSISNQVTGKNKILLNKWLVEE